jgi:hypothetical protein
MTTSPKAPAPISSPKVAVKTPTQIKKAASPAPKATKVAKAAQKKVPMSTRGKAPAVKSANPSKKLKAAGKLEKPVVKPIQIKPVKTKKVKMVRDSLSVPKDEYVVLDALKLRAAKLGNPIKKTEAIRAGIKALAAMNDEAFLASLRAVPNLKTGRPSKTV